MYGSRRYIFAHELQGNLLCDSSKIATSLQEFCWGVASPWHSDFIAIVKRIRNEVVTTLVRSAHHASNTSNVLASDLRVGNDPCA